jgi:DNA gyrase subunit A
VADISIVGRNTQGVRLIRLDEGERLTGVERVEGLDAGEDSTQADSAGSSSEQTSPPG